MNEITKRSLYDICVNHGDVMIIDVMNYLHRYMWVHKDLSVIIDGEPVNTGHLYGFTNFMLFLKDRFPNCAIVLALDGIDLSRRATNSGYKAQRTHSYTVDAEMDDLISMCSLVEGVYTCFDKDYEADDAINVIAKTVSKMCIKNNIKKKVYILSNDKDMFQLVTENPICEINIIRKFGSGNAWYEESDIVRVDGVREKFNGVGPDDLVKFRAIVGDSSDNLKGYYRFRKANAAIIAENYDYDVESGVLTLKENVRPGLSWKKFLPTVLDDMQTFRDNYAIMKLKDFDFEILPVNTVEYMKPINEVVETLKKYQLNKYMYKVPKYSQYRDEILRNV